MMTLWRKALRLAAVAMLVAVFGALSACGADAKQPSLNRTVKDALTKTVDAPSVGFNGTVRVVVPNGAPSSSLPGARLIRVTGVRNSDKSYWETIRSYDPHTGRPNAAPIQIRAVRTPKGFTLYFKQSGRWSKLSNPFVSTDQRFSELSAGVGTTPNAMLGFLNSLTGTVQSRRQVGSHLTRYTVVADLPAMAKEEPAKEQRADLRSLRLSGAKESVVRLDVQKGAVVGASRRSRLQYPDGVVTTDATFHYALRNMPAVVAAPSGS